MTSGRPLGTRFRQVGKFKINEARFQDFCQPETTGCVSWLGGRHRQGYGMVSVIDAARNRRTMTVAHRVAMMLKLGRELARSELVIHTCTNNLCVNPQHLVVGDYHEKDRVMIQKGHTQHRVPGSRSHLPIRKQRNRRYKWSDDEIRFIRTADTRAIAKRFAVTRETAGKMRYECRNRYRWLI